MKQQKGRFWLGVLAVLQPIGMIFLADQVTKDVFVGLPASVKVTVVIVFLMLFIGSIMTTWAGLDTWRE